MISHTSKTVFALLLSSTIHVQANDDFYVITGSHKTQAQAQQESVVKGGWVLNTNFYKQLTPNLYAVVRGPFKTKDAANEKLNELKTDGHPDSYVKNAGEIQIEAKIANQAVSPQLLAALLGELRIEVTEAKGGEDPCVPIEPYKRLALSYSILDRNYDVENDKETYTPKEVPLDIGTLWQLKQSGEIEHMRVCAE